jgi:hypothetical protein
MPNDTDWLLVGDFNMIPWPSDRNKPGGNIQDMLSFNLVVSNLRLEELQLIGNKYTWTNKSESPLLERLRLVFSFNFLDDQLPKIKCQNFKQRYL